jgi:superfamily II DNA helicase RecQ
MQNCPQTLRILGGAGRDGLPSHCKLFYNYSDKNILYRLFDEQYIAQYKGVNDLIVLLENPVQCLHQGIMSYFGEKHDSFICLTGCSNCKHRGTHQITDGTSDALKVLQAVVELSNINLTCNDLKLYLAGSNQKCVSHLQEYATFLSLGKKFVPVSLLAKFLHLLIVGDILTERIHKKGTGSSISVEITLGSKAHDLLANNIMIDKYEKT